MRERSQRCGYSAPCTWLQKKTQGWKRPRRTCKHRFVAREDEARRKQQKSSCRALNNDTRSGKGRQAFLGLLLPGWL